MKKISEAYGKYIKERRQKMGLTQTEVADKLGISQQAYGRYELGQREPDFKFIIEISKVLGCRPGEFFDNYRG